jgi:hypothetical protein
MTFTYTSYTKYKRYCPHCGNHFQTVFDIGAMRLGPGTRTCSNCDKSFLDGSVEWNQLAPADKKEFLFGDLRRLALYGWLPVVMLALCAYWRSDLKLFLLPLAGVLVLAIIILPIFYAICWVSITRSKKRSSGADSDQAAE